MRPGVVPTFWISAPTPNSGKDTVAVSTVTSAFDGPAANDWSLDGSYLTWIPLAVTVSASGTVIVRLWTLRVNEPGTVIAERSPAGSVMCCSAVSRLIWTSKVPTIPCRSALNPLELPPEPKASAASATSISIVRLRMPLLNEVPASPIEGPVSESGPSESGLEVVPVVAELVVTVKLPAVLAFGPAPAGVVIQVSAPGVEAVPV